MSGKYCIAVDLEGVACAVGAPGSGLMGSPDYPFVCKQGTKEANAAARALFESGADEVIIWDCHGTGVNLDYNMLDPRCKIVIGAGSRVRFPCVDKSFDGVLFIGYHAYDTPNATLAHVYSSSTFTGFKVNGEKVGELQIDAAIAGKRGVKTLFVSSDDICVAQAKATFPWVYTVETKKSLAWNQCLSRHPDTVCEDIYNTVLEAVRNIADMQVYTIAEPITLSVSYKRIEYANSCSLRDPDNKQFTLSDPYTRTGVLADIEDYFRF